METGKLTTEEAIGRLCTECGMCCNGVLFGDVELQSADAAEKYRKLGLQLERKGGKLRFWQPCPCLGAGRRCRIYADRPARCRSFECRLLQRVAAGTITPDAALRSIDRAIRQAMRVERQIEALGNTDRDLPLNQRYARIMAEPIDLAGDDAVVERRSELMLAVHGLMQVLERDFL